MKNKNIAQYSSEKSQRYSNKTGFTLVELLVAIAIFAVLSAMGWKVFDYLIKVNDRNAMHEENLGQLQEAYQQVQRDSLQIMPINANTAGQIQPALILANQKLTFSKAGVTDPLKQGLSPYERVEYKYNAQDKKLYRLKYSSLNMANSAQPLSSVLLADVDQYQISVLNPNERDRWPETTGDANNASTQALLPKGLKLKFTVRDVEYEWLFSLLNTDFLVQQSQSNQSNSNSNSSGGSSSGNLNSSNNSNSSNNNSPNTNSSN